jgi:hypothetical protein
LQVKPEARPHSPVVEVVRETVGIGAADVLLTLAEAGAEMEG